MEAARAVLVAISMAVVVVLVECGLSAQAPGMGKVAYSLRLIHRFSDEMRAIRVSRMGQGAAENWPEVRSSEYYRRLLKRDLERQKMIVGSQHQLLFPSEGSNTMAGGNDLGWLHYTWIDIGMPSVSFFVALDSGSDLLWLPCDCEHCAPLSASYYDNLGKDLNEYNPSRSSTSKSIFCNHQICEKGPTCKTSKQQCPYTVNYASPGTSSSGLLVQDIFHLASAGDNASNIYVRAPVIIGCGREQSGSYLDGIAPDGVLGLGLGEVSVPSFLAKAGIAGNSFSLCFGDVGSGRIYFGDQGLATQKTTQFLPMNGKYNAYVVGVDNCCIGTTCLNRTSFKAYFDSGTSFTHLPNEVYRAIAEEFDRQANATKHEFDNLPWQHCYKSSSQQLPRTPSVTLRFAGNNSFVIHNPLYLVPDDQGATVGFCLNMQPIDGDMGVIGQNFMEGYRLVFDRDNLTLGWSRSKCQDLKGERMPGSNASSPASLPTTEQQRAPSAHAVAPAVAGRAPSESSATSILLNSSGWSSLSKLLPLLLILFHQLSEIFSIPSM